MTMPLLSAFGTTALMFLPLVTSPGSPGSIGQRGSLEPAGPRTSTESDAAPAVAEFDAEMRDAILDGVLNALKENYVYPKVAEEMDAAVRAKREAGGYDTLDDGGRFVAALQSDLRAVCHDKHLTVEFSDAPYEPPGSQAEGPRPRDPFERIRRQNWGFRRVEVLEGNVGYLDLRSFAPVNEESSQVAAAAMTFLAGTDALIVDLRNNGGGSPAMVAFLSTYLFGGGLVHLNSLEEPRREYLHQWWTLPHVPGRRFGPDKPVMVLTSRYTFSAAEEFTYNLRQIERATIVGELTGGGAHPIDTVIVHPHAAVRVPFARAVNPISNDNWEGKGVEPHIEVEAGRALPEAHLAAVDRLIDRADDEEQREAWLALAKKLEQQL